MTNRAKYDYLEQCSFFEESEDEVKYKAFVEKFKPKKTTDDCYTPPLVYKAVKDYCIKKYGIDDENIVRPFYPGGDYEKFQYKSSDVVVDNPPFSILTNICRFYENAGIRFFLFSPYLTNFSVGRTVDVTHIITASNIVYENGANVPTCFVTNMESEYRCRTDIELHKSLKIAVEQAKRAGTFPKYKYDEHVITASMLGYMCVHGQELKIKRKDCAFISALDCQKEKGKTIFGGGFILSEKAAAEKAAAEKAAAEKAAAIPWELSEREKAIVRSLSLEEDEEDLR